MIGRIFINSTNVNTEDNANLTKTDGNNQNKSAITLVIFSLKSVSREICKAIF